MYHESRGPEPGEPNRVTVDLVTVDRGSEETADGQDLTRSGAGHFFHAHPRRHRLGERPLGEGRIPGQRRRGKPDVRVWLHHLEVDLPRRLRVADGAARRDGRL